MTSPVPAGPTDAHAQLREEIARAIFGAANLIVEAFPDYWERVAGGESTRDRYRDMAAAVLALRTVRDALAAQEPHCPTCICGRRAPVQGEYRRPGGPPGKPEGTVSWAEHLEAYTAYAAKFGKSQSAERLAERGGFGYWEITDLLGHEPTTWSVR